MRQGIQRRLERGGFLEVMSVTCHPGPQSWAHGIPNYSCSTPVGEGAPFAGSLYLPRRLWFGRRGQQRDRHEWQKNLSSYLLATLTLLRVSWRRTDLGREAWEVEGWPCSRAARKRSGHPRVTTDCLRQLIQDIGMGPRLGLPQIQPKEL